MSIERQKNKSPPPTIGKLSQEDLQKAIHYESQQFETFYRWLELHMPSSFFEEFEQSHLMTIAHNLMGFNLQGNFIQIHFDSCSIVLCLDSSDADLKILKNYAYFGIKNYQTFISDEPPPIKGVKQNLRIAIIHFTQIQDDDESGREEILSEKTKQTALTAIKEKNPEITREEFDEIYKSLNARFLRGLNKERLVMTLEMFFRAKSRDHIQYEVKYNEDWDKNEKDMPSMQIVLAWRNTQKFNFLYRLAKLVYRHNLVMKRVNSAYVHPYSEENILVMSLAIHGQGNKASWEVTDIKDFLQELSTLKYFEDGDAIESTFVATKLLRGNSANLIRAMISLAHQFLLHKDPNLYSHTNVEEGVCANPKLTKRLSEAFDLKFHPENHNYKQYENIRDTFLDLVGKIDTGNLSIDTRRKHILSTMMHLVDHIDKTNFFRNNKSTLAFRINPKVMDLLPYERKEKFPELPYAIFFLKGKSSIGFHIRFKDLSRGGIRTIFPYRPEQGAWERSNIFSECYNLAYTQQKKNKDIPEGGAKGVIFIEPFEEMHLELQIYRKELIISGMDEKKVEEKIETFQKEQRLIYLYQAQRSYIYSLITLVNCFDDGKLKSRDILDYYKKPEYLYFGPDENMHNSMIEWIAEHGKITTYKPGKALISSKPKFGINHKEYGVTSLGVNVYMEKILHYMNINPEKDVFTLKISGGPDGDVAGNQILNLYKYYPNTAKLLAITDVSGTIYDPEGLDLKELVGLFQTEKPIRFYPAEKLSDGGFLLDLYTKHEESSYVQHTLCYRKEGKKLIKDWLDGNDTHHLFSHNLHQTIADVFIPAGGRPRTLDGSNWKDFLDPTGEPTSQAIIEAANLYLTQDARDALESKGVLIVKDSSANKGGVICSSLEVLVSLVMSDSEFLKEKGALMPEILEFLKEKAADEANLLIKTHETTQKPMTEISETISRRINTYMYQILDYLDLAELPKNTDSPILRCLVDYCPMLLRKKYQKGIFENIPEPHKKAIIACYIAARIVYNKGLKWTPSIVDVLPLIIHGFDQIP